MARGKQKPVATGDLLDELIADVDGNWDFGRVKKGVQTGENTIRRLQIELKVFPELKKLYHNTSRELSKLIVESSIDPTPEIKKLTTALIERFEREESRIKDESNRGSQ